MTTHLGFHGLSPSIWKNHVSICLLCLFKTDALLVIHKCLVNAMSTCRKWCVRQASAMPGNILSSNFWSCLSRSLKMFKYYPSGIRRPAGVSCGSCFFVVVLSVLSLSCLDFPLSRIFELEPTPSPPAIRFVLIFPYDVVGSTLPTPRTTQAWFCTSCCHFDGCFRFFVVFVIGLLRRFLYPMLDPLAFVPNTFYTHNLSKYCLFQSRSQYGLFQNPGLHTCFDSNLNRGLNKTNVFASKSKPSFTQRAVLHRNCVIHEHHVLHKNHVLAGPAQGLFAAYRIARRNTPKAVK